jgi:hypothetical protein
MGLRGIRSRAIEPHISGTICVSGTAYSADLKIEAPAIGTVPKTLGTPPQVQLALKFMF